MMILLYITEGCDQVPSSSMKLKQNFSFTMHFTSISFKCKAAKYRLKVVMTPGLILEFSIVFFQFRLQATTSQMGISATWISVKGFVIIFNMYRISLFIIPRDLSWTSKHDVPQKDV